MTEQPRTIERFCKGDHVVYWGDAIRVLDEHVADSTVQLIFADPPYNIGKRFAGFIDKWPTDADYAKWCHRWLDLCVKKLTPNGTMYVMASTQSMPYLDLYLRERMCVLSRIVWHYDSSGVQARGYFGSAYEPILFCVNDSENYTFNAHDILIKAKTGAERRLIDYRKSVPAMYSTDKVPGNAWYFPRVRYRMPEYENHPSQKPEALLERIVRASSNPGDTILDPFAGTFTASAVARRLGRSTISIELQEEFVKVGLRRLQIQDRLNGELLRPLDKKYTRRNANGRKSVSTQERTLFED